MKVPYLDTCHLARRPGWSSWFLAAGGRRAGKRGCPLLQCHGQLAGEQGCGQGLRNFAVGTPISLPVSSSQS